MDVLILARRLRAASIFCLFSMILGSNCSMTIFWTIGTKLGEDDSSSSSSSSSTASPSTTTTPTATATATGTTAGTATIKLTSTVSATTAPLLHPSSTKMAHVTVAVSVAGSMVIFVIAAICVVAKRRHSLGEARTKRAKRTGYLKLSGSHLGSDSEADENKSSEAREPQKESSKNYNANDDDDDDDSMNDRRNRRLSTIGNDREWAGQTRKEGKGSEHSSNRSRRSHKNNFQFNWISPIHYVAAITHMLGVIASAAIALYKASVGLAWEYILELKERSFAGDLF
eukprot:m.138279 g.138279  ORF g.138279 m.138279 type:complete len:285 (+) comp13154_c4_seq16:2187-3041(+)